MPTLSPFPVAEEGQRTPPAADPSPILPLPVFQNPWHKSQEKQTLPAWPGAEWPQPAAAQVPPSTAPVAEPIASLPVATAPRDADDDAISKLLSPFLEAIPRQTSLANPEQRPAPHFQAQAPPMPHAESLQPAPAPVWAAPAPSASPFLTPEPAPLPQNQPLSPAPPPPAQPPPPAAPVWEPAAYTDDDLREALVPLIAPLFRGISPGQLDLASLEPMMRSTVRRALAEHSPHTRPFHPPRMLDRTLWHLKALFTSRTYEEILFEKTRRFQVEEVYLFDANTYAMVSYASSDPARHSTQSRVNSAASRLALQLRDAVQAGQAVELPLTDGRTAYALKSENLTLAAIIRGSSDEIIASDLQYALGRIDSRFSQKLKENAPDLLHAIQPYLEDCLLIQAPSAV